MARKQTPPDVRVKDGKPIQHPEHSHRVPLKASEFKSYLSDKRTKGYKLAKQIYEGLIADGGGPEAVSSLEKLIAQRIPPLILRLQHIENLQLQGVQGLDHIHFNAMNTFIAASRRLSELKQQNQLEKQLSEIQAELDAIRAGGRVINV